ncbi:hypothetical protein BKA62DRAFT_491687 [Auriculariales sp. MPI-PUGE-AT-0066]|nr:hypothetical protein BKA62DRAFT_491687 [Auriculariales sp. MPI-PUGE-AT-0066]
MSRATPVAKWASRHKLQTRPWLIVLPVLVLVSVFTYSTWISTARRCLDLSALWQRRLYKSRHLWLKEQGLLVLNKAAHAKHPVADLIMISERRWKAKLDAQSATLQDAYDEYIRRYKRRPPKGFDEWWKWSKSAGVQLLDEYDQLNSDLEIFWALSPKDMREAQHQWERHEDTFTIGKQNATSDPELLTYNLTDENLEKSGKWRAGLQMGIINPVKEHIPPFRATWTAHDAPRLFISWELREQARKAVESGTYIDFSKSKDMPAVWASACSPDSPLRKTFDAKQRYHSTDGYLRAPKSFITDFRTSMNPCQSPDLIHLSTFADFPDGPQPRKAFVPAFTRSKTFIHADILGIPTEDVMNEKPDDVPFAEKTEPRMLWRGRTTGMAISAGKMWNMSHRLRFVELTNRKRGRVAVLPPPADVADMVSPAAEWDLGELNRWFFDTGIVEAVQCDPDICEKIKQNYAMKKIVWPEDGKHYKYVMDMDGNGWSSRFRRLMDRNAVVFKSTIYPEWWTDRAEPWVHFVPVKMDYSDIYDTLAFFRGMPDGTPGHEEYAERIADAGREWVDQFWRREDVTAYTWRIYLEYVRLLSDDRDKMDFHMER